MHLDKCTTDVNNPHAFAPRLRRPEAPLQGSTVPHADPQRLTKLSATSVELSRNGCPLPSVSMFCNDLLASESKSALCLSVVEDLCSHDRGSGEFGQLDKVGCMNPFKAYLVSKADAERTKMLERKVVSRQDSGDGAAGVGGSGGFVDGGPMMVLHTMCSTEQEGTSLYGTELASLSLDTTLRTSSPLSDEAGGGSHREASSDTARTVPYSVLEVSTPESTPLGFGCAGASHKATFNTSRDGREGFPSTASRDLDRSVREENNEGYEDGVSIFTGESRSLLDTLLSYSPRPGEIYSQEHPPPAPATLGGCSVMCDTRKSMMSSHPCPEGSELDFGWTFGRSVRVPNTTMGSTSVEEAWENFFPPSGTITSTRTCLTSWEHYFGSDKPKANSSEQPAVYRPPPVVPTIPAQCPDELSSLEYSDLASYSPRQKAMLGWAKPEIEEDWDEDDFGDEAPSPRQYQHSMGKTGPASHPNLGPPMQLISNEVTKPSVGERVVTGVLTSSAHPIERGTSSECIVTQRVGATSWHRGSGLLPGSMPNEVTDRSRQRFSVFLETGYPHVTAFNPFEEVQTIQPAVKPHPPATGKAKKRSLWSIVSHLFTCFHEGEDMRGFEDRGGPLGHVNELPHGYKEYQRRSGLLKSTKASAVAAAGSSLPRSLFGRQKKRRWWSLESRPPSRGSTTYIPAAGPNGSHRRLKTFTGESNVSDGCVETPGTTGTPVGSSEYRYSQRHRFLREKIEQERFNMESPAPKI